MRLNHYRLFIKALLVVGIASCGRTTPTNTPKRAWDYENAPERLGLKSNNYERNFNLLKKRAKLSKKPWTGDFWASYLGGIAYRWNEPNESDNFRVFYKLKPMAQLKAEEIPLLSPAEKMDLINFDESYEFTRDERERTEVMSRQKGEEIPEWYGLCHAWAPATFLFKEPAPIVYKRSDGLEIPLGSGDIKAMLTYFIHETDSKSYMVSRRCDVDDAKLKRKVERGKISLARYKEIMESADCRGVNPGAFHILLANMIGIRNKSFILDVTRDVEVWNHPIYSYRSKVLNTRTQNFSKEADPKTVKEVRVRTVMSYISEFESEWEKDTILDTLDHITYEYWLELDHRNRIIGGTWISHERPDFAWTQERPRFGNRFKFLRDIYRQSVRQENTPRAPGSIDPKEETEEKTEEETEKEETNSESRLIKVNSHKRIPSLFGERLEMEGMVHVNAAKLKLEYFLDNGKKFKTRWIPVLHDQTFKSATFTWGKVDKITKVRLTAFSPSGPRLSQVTVDLD